MLGLLDLVGPELVERVLVINAPSFFSIIFNIFKPMLSARTQAKISICGSDYQQDMFEAIDPRFVPRRYGGSLDEFGYLFQDDSVLQIPKEFYRNSPIEGPHAVQVEIKNGESHRHSVAVNVAGARLSWEVWSCDHEIKFWVEWSPLTGGQAAEVVVPSQVLLCHQCREVDFLECGRVGIYEVVLDNGAAWFKNARLVYALQVL
eukprot:TRINITY_DN14452_c0_g1_i3.p1 TRINITY_DN14452_c0_g1~~TRINITY_DN14452_c0_g1_i3.p1  ORF type:complete len:204 (+),score=35.67 TRINITY_DN14452_c0_g1_i3:232-843(+)